MWAAHGTVLQMTEGDYGIRLPIKISGITFAQSDMLKFTFLDKKNGNIILEKEYSSIEDNTVFLELIEEESNLFDPRSYVYRLDWYQDGNFMCNIIPEATFKVVDKA